MADLILFGFLGLLFLIYKIGYYYRFRLKAFFKEVKKELSRTILYYSMISIIEGLYVKKPKIAKWIHPFIGFVVINALLLIVPIVILAGIMLLYFYAKNYIRYYFNVY